MTRPHELRPGIYQHYKGGYYIALHLTQHHDTGEKYVVYVSVDSKRLWVREWDTPGKKSWCDEVKPHDQQPLAHPHEVVARFRYLGPA